MKSIGQALYDYRKYRDVSQQVIADELGINRSYYVEIENGKRIPGKETLRRIVELIRK